MPLKNEGYCYFLHGMFYFLLLRATNALPRCALFFGFDHAKSLQGRSLTAFSAGKSQYVSTDERKAVEISLWGGFNVSVESTGQVQQGFEKKRRGCICTPLVGILHPLNHFYDPPFCERHRWGHETSALPLSFRICYTSLVGLAHYSTRGGEWRGCIAANLAFLYGVGCL